MKAIILAGGKGTRFWPLSSDEKPKQFLKLISKETMLQLTYNRFRSWLPAEKIYVVTSEKYLSLVEEQLPELPADQIILEPFQRDTAPCIALTALHFLNQNDDEVLVTAPADQYIENNKKLQYALTIAEEVAQQDESIVTLGIYPTGPETGYGYVKAKKTSDSFSSIFQVANFIEKPDISTAERLIELENVFWNSGIFVWKPSTIASNFQKYQLEMWEILKNNQSKLSDVYSLLPKISIDYAIMEKAKDVYTVQVDFGWDDLGSWTSIERMQHCDMNNNSQKGEVMVSSAKNCVVCTDRKTLLIGVEDLIVALTDQGLLVCHKSKEQEIKNFFKGGNFTNEVLEGE